MLRNTKENLLSDIRRFIIENGKYPTKTDCRGTDWLKGIATYRRVLGSFKNMTMVEDIYNENPKFCLNCDIPIIFSKKVNIYCSHSCSAIANNTKKSNKIKEHKEALKRIYYEKPILDYSCSGCGVLIQSRTERKYCSIVCQSDARVKERLDAWLVSGETTTNRVLRTFLTSLYGHFCSVCRLSEWQGKPIVLEVEHKSGNSEDDSHDNVCLICPNCHSQTDTYKGKNRGNGRHSRRERYAEGKSY